MKSFPQIRQVYSTVLEKSPPRASNVGAGAYPETINGKGEQGVYVVAASFVYEPFIVQASRTWCIFDEKKVSSVLCVLERRAPVRYLCYCRVCVCNVFISDRFAFS